jgi:putative ABC transport system substrate-binding protein
MDFAMGNLGQLRDLLKSEFIERSVACQIAYCGQQADQSFSPCSKADRPHDAAERARKSRQGDQMTEVRDQKSEIGKSRRTAMAKKIIFLALCSLLLAPCSAVESQQPKKVARIGYLSTQDPASESARTEAIKLALRERGYIEGRNIAIEYRYSEGRVDRAPELAAELVHLKIDLIVAAGGDPWIRAAKNATKTIPIVMVGSGTDPVEAGFVESLARPGGNVTGLTNLSRGLGGKRLELLKEAVSKIARVAVFYEPANPQSVVEVKEVLPVTAGTMRLTIQPLEVRAADDFEKVFAAIGKQRPDGLYVLTSPLMRSNAKRIAGAALKSRLPSVYGRREFVDSGGLMYYGADEADSYRRVAYYVDKILKGAKPADLPVEQPTKFELVINLKTAKQIGVTIPQRVLGRADKVIR